MCHWRNKVGYPMHYASTHWLSNSALCTAPKPCLSSIRWYLCLVHFLRPSYCDRQVHQRAHLKPVCNVHSKRYKNRMWAKVENFHEKPFAAARIIAAKVQGNIQGLAFTYYEILPISIKLSKASVRIFICIHSAYSRWWNFPNKLSANRRKQKLDSSIQFNWTATRNLVGRGISARARASSPHIIPIYGTYHGQFPEFWYSASSINSLHVWRLTVDEFITLMLGAFSSTQKCNKRRKIFAMSWTCVRSLNAYK